MKKIDGPWSVHTKGGPGESFEITVLHSSDKHGAVSYGWYSKTKLYISGGDEGFDCVNAAIWKELTGVARRICEKMNRAAGGGLQ